MAALLNDLSGRGHHASIADKVETKQRHHEESRWEQHNHGETSIEFAPSLSNAPQLLTALAYPTPGS